MHVRWIPFAAAACTAFTAAHMSHDPVRWIADVEAAATAALLVAGLAPAEPRWRTIGIVVTIAQTMLTVTLLWWTSVEYAFRYDRVPPASTWLVLASAAAGVALSFGVALCAARLAPLIPSASAIARTRRQDNRSW